MNEFYALVPAAGLGTRMQCQVPKQYLTLMGRPLIYYALKTLCESPDITTVFVILAAGDNLFKAFDWSVFGNKLQPLYCGGETRSATVLNGLLLSEMESDDWVLVHDAARPCLTQLHLSKLITELRIDSVGGLLAVPVADTLKRADERDRIAQTENRDHLWQAQTPQMFRVGLLAQALQMHADVTDDASAIEKMGLKPKLVLGDTTNFKVTFPQDKFLAELLLREQLIQS